MMMMMMMIERLTVSLGLVVFLWSRKIVAEMNKYNVYP